MKRTLNLAGLDVVRDVLRAPAVDLAASGESSAEDLLDGTLQVLGHGLELHLACDLDDLIERDGLSVLDVLLLLPVPRRLLEGLDDEGGGGGHNRDGGLTVLDGQTDGDTQTLPVTGGLGDIFTDLLGRQTERTDLRGGYLSEAGFDAHMRFEWSSRDSPSGPERTKHPPHHRWHGGG